MENEEDKLEALQAALDSIARENRQLQETREELIELTERQEQLAAPANLKVTQNIVELAKIYDEMKPKMAAPLFAGMNDTLAVMILHLMDTRNAGKVISTLGADSTTINKSMAITRLMAEQGIEIPE